MKKFYCVSMVMALLMLMCEARRHYPYPTSYPTASPSDPVNLKGKMLILSASSGVTFYPPYWDFTATKSYPSWTTAWPTNTYPTTPSPTKSVSVCLRHMTNSINTVFQLGSGSTLTLKCDSYCRQFTLTSSYYSSVSLMPSFIFANLQTPPWTSVCLSVDSVKGVAQLYVGGTMSIKKLLTSQMVWSGEPVLDVSGFDGQVKDIEVWDYPLDYGQILSYMRNYGSSGNVLTWSNIVYQLRGKALLEESFPRQQKEPISSGEGRGQRMKNRKRFSERKHRGGKRQL